MHTEFRDTTLRRFGAAIKFAAALRSQMHTSHRVSKLLTLHNPRQIFLQALLTRDKRDIKLAGQINMSING